MTTRTDSHSDGISHALAVGVVAGTTLLLSACAGHRPPVDYARNSAASDHRCHSRGITLVETQQRTRGAKGYWLDVCGDLRFYERKSLPIGQKLGVLQRQHLLTNYRDMTARLSEADVPPHLRDRWRKAIVPKQCCDTLQSICGQAI